MVTRQQGNERLLALAQHLETGQMGHETFDFMVFNVTSNKKFPGAGVCGTDGCALGECPIVFPDDWEFEHNHASCPKLIRPVELGIPKDQTNHTFDHAAAYFSIEMNEVLLLFKEGSDPFNIPIEPSPHDVTKEEVAAKLRAFVDWRGDGD